MRFAAFTEFRNNTKCYFDTVEKGEPAEEQHSLFNRPLKSPDGGLKGLYIK